MSAFSRRWALVATIVMAGGRAHANGAFPDSLRIFVPADRPAEIILATNFGLIMSRDDGASWDWVCEHGDGFLATQYQMAAPPSRRLFAVAPAGLAYSDDDACGWSLAVALMSTTVTDAFADPVNSNRVLALGSFVDPNGQAQSGLFVSADAGKTLGAPKYLAPAASSLVSVEVAASRADRIYLTAFHSNLGRPPGGAVIRSDDGGGTWTLSDVTPVTGERIVRIAAVDPTDPQKVYFRVTGTEDAIGLSVDGGATMTLPLVVTTQLTGLLRRANGQILVSALDVADGALYQSTDAGKSSPNWPRVSAFALWPSEPGNSTWPPTTSSTGSRWRSRPTTPPRSSRCCDSTRSRASVRAATSRRPARPVARCWSTSVPSARRPARTAPTPALPAAMPERIRWRQQARAAAATCFRTTRRSGPSCWRGRLPRS